MFAPITAQAITLQPVKFFVTIDPGGEQALVIKVTNDDKIKKSYSAGILGAKQNDQGATVFFENIDEAERWVSVAPATFSLNPGRSTEVRYFIKSSGLAAPGAHYLGLVVSENNETIDGVGIQTAAAALLTIQVSGRAEEKLAINFDARQQIWNKNFIVDLDYKNTGNIQVGFKTDLTVTDWRGREVFVGATQMSSLLSKAERHTAVAVRPAGKIVLFNVYNIEARTVYGRLGQVERSREKIIFISPIFVALIIPVLVLIAMGLASRRKKHVFFPK